MLTGFLVLLLLALLVLLVLAGRSRRRRGQVAGSAWPYVLRRPMSSPEQVLYHRLVNTLPGHIVLAHVPVSYVLGVKAVGDYQAWMGRIDGRSYDFVVCAMDATVLAAIELDEGSHDAPRRQKTDQVKMRASAAAGLRVIRWHVKSLPDEAAIRGEFS